MSISFKRLLYLALGILWLMEQWKKTNTLSYYETLPFYFLDLIFLKTFYFEILIWYNFVHAKIPFVKIV